MQQHPETNSIGSIDTTAINADPLPDSAEREVGIDSTNCDFAAHSILLSSHLDVLHDCMYKRFCYSTPSWVPDWNRTRQVPSNISSKLKKLYRALKYVDTGQAISIHFNNSCVWMGFYLKGLASFQNMNHLLLNLHSLGQSRLEPPNRS